MRRQFVPSFWIAATALLLTAAPEAWAAVGYQIGTEPQRPVVGQETLITVVTTLFGTGQDGASPEPFPMPDFPWEFVADAPSGARHTIALTPGGTSQSEWLARFTFDEAGDWDIGLHLRHLASPYDPTLGARATVTVVSSTSSGPDERVALLGAAVAVGGLAVLGLWVRRTRSTRSHGIR
ncbi:MAG: hypothetical protein L0227_12530 [Chloroflexi bacterium]|nr:hypothetical protein [Chloroflexota bacterium]